MKILIYCKNESMIDGIIEKEEIPLDTVLIADNPEKAVSLLYSQQIKKLFIDVTSIHDLKIIKYINNKKLNTKISLFGENIYKEIIPIIKESNFDVIQEIIIKTIIKNSEKIGYPNSIFAVSKPFIMEGK